MRYLIRLFTIAVLAALPAGLPAQEAACVNGQLIPYFGWDETACSNCVMRGYYTEFLGRPSISSIRSDGPAAGRLREHDMLLAVDGLDITTPDAWHRLRDAKSGEPLRFTVSNDGVTRDETIRVATRCMPAAQQPETRIIIIRRKPGRK